jgi:uncharacterized protein YaiI (UPF0178 family)
MLLDTHEDTENFVMLQSMFGDCAKSQGLNVVICASIFTAANAVEQIEATDMKILALGFCMAQLLVIAEDAGITSEVMGQQTAAMHAQMRANQASHRQTLN